ncbi:twin-arginine translocase TatA/TatE family subunit [Kribbella sp.]|uniref:twin-arginine translocase TatA/TatE family subunit n=1 Tax=Kribbella sp. TaxID=1871183 RepID=UPI002D54BB88|nr:twin-arginine translocase TatA/TatE family subunit [Kribbella sp.]HZX03397.1 twin-arginine translocase TatA/TatE family subunit [Kribbella sp.]
MIDLFGMPRGEEWIVLLVVVILIFGPTKLPGLVRQLGRAKKTWDEEFGPGRHRDSLDNTDQAAPLADRAPTDEQPTR